VKYAHTGMVYMCIFASLYILVIVEILDNFC